jgi:hypothetical protein
LGAPKRAWYGSSWVEYGGDAFGDDYETGVSGDDSWFDEDGLFLTGDSATIFSSTSKLADLHTHSDAYSPSFITLRSGSGQYVPETDFISIESGFAGQTGTWVARMMLPDSVGVGSPLSFYPAFWTKSGESYIEERDENAFGGEIFKEHTHDKVWSEANFEFYQNLVTGFPSTGVTWGNTYSSRRGSGSFGAANPILAAPGQDNYECWMSDDSGNWYNTTPVMCKQALNGTLFGPLFATYYITIDTDHIKYYIIAWDEDLYHNRPSSAPGNYAGFDVLYMETITPMTNFVPPRWMGMLFDSNLKNGGSQSGTLSEDKDQIVDWVFYTPEVLTPTSDPSVWNVPGMVHSIRNHLWTAYNANNKTAQVWRVNNVPRGTGSRPVESPMDLDTGGWSCADQGVTRSPQFDNLAFDMKNYKYANTVFFSPETVTSGNSYTLQSTFGVTFDVSREKIAGGGVFLYMDTQENEGFVYEADVSQGQWTYSDLFKIDVTVDQYHFATSTFEACGSPYEYTYYYDKSEDALYSEYPAWKKAPTSIQPTLSYELLESYPNPFSTEVSIPFVLASDMHVRLEVFDALGRSVELLVDEELPEGSHTVTFDGKDLPIGLFFYRIQTPRSSGSKAMLHMR